MPHDYSTITAPSHDEHGGQARQDVREEEVVSLPAAMGGQGGAMASSSLADGAANGGNADSATSHIDPTPVQGSSARGISMEVTPELVSNSAVPESDSGHKASSIPSLGPDLLGPEPVPVTTSPSGLDKPPTLHKDAANSDSGTVSSEPIITDKSNDISAEHIDNSAHERGMSPGNTRHTINEGHLDSESGAAESPASKTSSGNSLEQIPHRNNTDGDLGSLEPGGREGSGRDGVNAPLTTADSSGMEREGAVNEQYQTAEDIQGRQWSKELPAGSASDGDAVAESEANTGPTQRDHIPANTGAGTINGSADLDSLGHQAAHHPTSSGSLSPQNASSETGSQGPPNTTEAAVGGGSVEGAGGAGGAGGKGVDDLGSKNGNQTGDIIGGPNGTSGVLGNASQGGSVQNQTEAALNRNGNQTGGNGTPPGSGGNGVPAQQKEKSVFLRLSKQIDNLEANMTLFSIFLDQISAR